MDVSQGGATRCDLGMLGAELLDLDLQGCDEHLLGAREVAVLGQGFRKSTLRSSCVWVLLTASLEPDLEGFVQHIDGPIAIARSEQDAPQDLERFGDGWARCPHSALPLFRRATASP